MCMSNDEENVLSGKNNKRLEKSTPTNKESTAAWSEENKIVKLSHVSIPSSDNVQKAKEWVDDGSKL